MHVNMRASYNQHTLTSIQSNMNLRLCLSKGLENQLHLRPVLQTCLGVVVACEFPSNTEPSSDSTLEMQPVLGHGLK